MKNITLKKIELSDIIVLQNELLKFITAKSAVLRSAHVSNLYFDAILFVDVASRMYYTFRSKLEKTTAITANLNLNATEAVVLLQCCNSNQGRRNQYEDYCMQKFSKLLHEELINLTSVQSLQKRLL